MQGEALARVSLLAVALSLVALPRAAAQVDPEVPTDTCAVTLGVVDGDPVRLDEFNLGQQILVRDEGGCAPANTKVRAALRGEPRDFRLGETMSEDDGSYVIRGEIPSRADYGTHLIVVDAGKKKYTKAIQIVPKSATEPIDRGRVAAMSAAALFIALGIGVVVVPRRGRWRMKQAPASGAAETEVPFIDTSGFVPMRDDSRRAKPQVKKPQTTDGLDRDT
ncbi:MAG: hypothetical protein WD179_10490 [Actinomycetota bacterium]